ncbi:N-glycosylation protein-domain-containing protein [Xylariaceae sp. FL0804]|nr:N-glycosylation protein-domain-containing protein [Xylariaceae sp. FL0804]
MAYKAPAPAPGEHRDGDGRPPHPVPAVAVSLLQPRVAVALGIPKRWHLTLSACRLLSCVPSGVWGAWLALRFLVAELVRFHQYHHYGPGHGRAFDRDEASLRATETALAIVWCGAAAYLAFFFTDCLMSRWLINYTPQATVVRLCTVNCVYGYLTSWVIWLTGAAADPGLLLPAWISISTILTLCYHFTQRKIRIRKETFASISVFSFASFISMVALLLQSHSTRGLYRQVPLFSLARRSCEAAAHFAVHVLGVKGDAVNVL